MSIHDISAQEAERSYHLFALGLLVIFTNQYIVISNRESGFGRYDIMLIPKEKSDPGIIIEFKKLDNKETMSECANRALEQIKERNYAAQLVQHGIKRIVAFGIAQHKKKVLLRQEEL